MLILLAVACDDAEFPVGEAGTIVGDDYDSVQQIFEGYCVSCHRASGPVAGLDLETDACSALVEVASSRTQPYVVPGDSGSSVLWARVANTGEYGGVMPPSGQMPEANIDTIAAWIDAGASCSGAVATLDRNGISVAGGGW